MSSQKGWFTPAKNVLLTGAGFTKDFGGHLASEMWSVILNQPEIRRYPSLREILLGELNFEQVYDQVPARSSPEEQAAFHSALNNAYGQMHRGICQPENDTRSSAVCSNFLAQFQKRRDNQQEKAFFFTLNQDLFVERFYLNNFNHEGLIKIPGLQHQKWFNWQLSDELQQEDLRQLPDEDQMEAIKREFWSKSTENFAYVKLHGSYGWIDKDGTQKMVMGNTKTGVIQREPLLRWYLSLFAKVLSQENQNLVVVGYGFRDDHINKVITDAISEHGLRLFVVSPKQPRDFRQMLFSEGCGETLWRGLFGYHSGRVTDFHQDDGAGLSPPGKAFFDSLE